MEQVTEQDIFEPIEEQDIQTSEPEAELNAKPEEKPEEKPFDAAKHFQSLADKRDAENKKLQDKLAVLEQEFGKLKNPPQQAPKEPEPLPSMPQGFNLTDAVADPDGVYGQWYQRKLQQDVEKDIYDRYWRGQITAEREQTKADRNAAAQKAVDLGYIQQAGAAPEEAEKIYNWARNQEGQDFYESLVKFYRYTNSQPSSQTQRKIEEFDNRAERSDIPLPPGSYASRAEEKKTPDDAFNEGFKRKESRTI